MKWLEFLSLVVVVDKKGKIVTDGNGEDGESRANGDGDK